MTKKRVIMHEPNYRSTNIKEIIKYSDDIKKLGLGMNWTTNEEQTLYILGKDYDKIVFVVTGLDGWDEGEKMHHGTMLAKSIYEKHPEMPVVLATYSKNKLDMIPKENKKLIRKYFTGGCYTKKDEFFNDMKKWV